MTQRRTVVAHRVRRPCYQQAVSHAVGGETEHRFEGGRVELDRRLEPELYEERAEIHSARGYIQEDHRLGDRIRERHACGKGKPVPGREEYVRCHPGEGLNREAIAELEVVEQRQIDLAALEPGAKRCQIALADLHADAGAPASESPQQAGHEERAEGEEAADGHIALHRTRARRDRRQRHGDPVRAVRVDERRAARLELDRGCVGDEDEVGPRSEVPGHPAVERDERVGESRRAGRAPAPRGAREPVVAHRRDTPGEGVSDVRLIIP